MAILQTMGNFLFFLFFAIFVLLIGIPLLIGFIIFADKKELNKRIDGAMKDCNEIRQSSKTPVLSDEWYQYHSSFLFLKKYLQIFGFSYNAKYEMLGAEK